MNPQPAQLTDARGRALAPGPYRRVASLVPSLTETVCALGAGQRLVARTVFCVEPRAWGSAVTACGGTKNPDVERILAARPDLVLACLEENPVEVLESLQQAGCAVFAVMPRTLADVAGLLEDFGILLDRTAEAAAAVADLTEARAEVAPWRERAAGRRLRGATLIWKDPWMAAGGQTYIDAVMNELGVSNALAGRPDYFEVSTADLADLDVVLLPDEPYPFTHHDAWRLAAAGAVCGRRRAIILDGKLLCWYGARTAASLQALRAILAGRLD